MEVGKKETSTLVNDYESVLSSVFSRETDELQYLRICAIKGISPIDMRQ